MCTDEPLVVSVLDGNTIRLFLEDEDDFAMLAENLFTDLDAEDEGKLNKNEIRRALANMGVEMGVPPVSDFPMVNDILKKHGAEGEEKLGQAQFAQLLQPILQDLADALALKHVTVLQNVKITNGSKLRKVLADKNQFDDLIEKMYQQTCSCQEEKGCAEIIRSYLENNGNDLGLPPLEANEAVILLYDAIFSEIDNKRKAKELEKNELGDLMKQILQKFAAQLQANPVFHDALI
ncbi:Calcium-binding mitochondrial carrier protein SCaMC-1 [Bienertia sinuspersici]